MVETIGGEVTDRSQTCVTRREGKRRSNTSYFSGKRHHDVRVRCGRESGKPSREARGGRRKLHWEAKLESHARKPNLLLGRDALYSATGKPSWEDKPENQHTLGAARALVSYWAAELESNARQPKLLWGQHTLLLIYLD